MNKCEVLSAVHPRDVGQNQKPIQAGCKMSNGDRLKMKMAGTKSQEFSRFTFKGAHSRQHSKLLFSFKAWQADDASA